MTYLSLSNLYTPASPLFKTGTVFVHCAGFAISQRLTEDPTYITNYQGARGKIAHIKKDELLTEIVQVSLI